MQYLMILANFCFNYFLLKRDAVNYMYNTNMIAQNSMFGTWEDGQVNGVYAIYADHVMETLLVNEDVTHYERKNWT
jgi:predicted secreted acid phosphatase